MENKFGGLPLLLLNGVRAADEDRIPNAGTIFQLGSGQGNVGGLPRLVWASMEIMLDKTQPLVGLTDDNGNVLGPVQVMCVHSTNFEFGYSVDRKIGIYPMWMMLHFEALNRIPQQYPYSDRAFNSCCNFHRSSAPWTDDKPDNHLQTSDRGVRVKNTREVWDIYQE